MLNKHMLARRHSWVLAEILRRHECRRGTHECVRHDEMEGFACQMTRFATAAICTLLSIVPAPGAVRLKDLASIEGVRDNQLVGYGIVVGLNGTGDKRQTVFSAQSLTNMLMRLGVSVPPTAILVRNTAAVLVTANLPPFAQPGTRIDASAAAVGDAANLQGGMLIMTPLRGADGQIYAVAQGSVVTGGFVAGKGGNSQTVNHPTVGRLPNAAIIERTPPSAPPGDQIKLQLHRADFTTAARVVEALNKRFGPAKEPVAHAENPALVVVNTPAVYANRRVEFVADVEGITVETDIPAKVVINERTGTIVVGKDVRISPASILQGALTVEIRTITSVSQPPPASKGTTAPTQQATASAKEDRAQNISLTPGATVDDLVRALMAIGSTPRDIIAIIQGLKSAGALDAEIEVL
jgi:flagellar P-ring protein FlgI